MELLREQVNSWDIDAPFKKTADNLSVTFDAIDSAEWDELIPQFDDASVYQTWEHDSVHWGESRLSHAVFCKKGRVVALAQVRILQIPVLRAGIAYVPRGPVWRRHGSPPDPGLFQDVARALREEYAVRRGLVLRLFPNEFDTDVYALSNRLELEGYRKNNIAKPYRTFFLDLSPPLEELRMGLKPKWRSKLTKAERTNFEIIVGSGDDLYAAFLGLYAEMYQRKQFTEYVDVHEYREIQRRLPEALKMAVMLCRLEGRPQAALVTAAVGDTALLVFLATSREALETRAAFRLFWEQIKWLKAQCFRYLDIGGVDPDANPGGFQFKSGIGGQDLYALGVFETCTSPLSFAFTQCGEIVRRLYREMRASPVSFTRRFFSAAKVGGK